MLTLACLQTPATQRKRKPAGPLQPGGPTKETNEILSILREAKERNHQGSSAIAQNRFSFDFANTGKHQNKGTPMDGPPDPGALITE